MSQEVFTMNTWKFLVPAILALPMVTQSMEMNDPKQIKFLIQDKENLYADVVPQIKEKYVLACPVLQQNVDQKENTISIKAFRKPVFNAQLFSFMMPCLKLNYHLHQHDETKKNEHIQKFNYLLATCGQENLVDIIDVANTLDLQKPLALAISALNLKLKKQVGSDDYIEKGFASLQLRSGSIVKQQLIHHAQNEKKAQRKKTVQSTALIKYPLYTIQFRARDHQVQQSPSWWAKIKKACAFILWG